MTTNGLRVAIVTGTLKLGGSSIFVYNLAAELTRRQVSCLVVSGEAEHHMEPEFSREGIAAVILNEKTHIFEDRLTTALQCLSKFKPNVVIANLGHFAFEVLRYVPSGVNRIGLVHSDDPNVYRTLEAYSQYIDVIVGVSTTIVDRLENTPAFQSVLKRYVPCGVPMPYVSLRKVLEGPLRILYVGRLANEQKRVDRFPLIAAKLGRSGHSFSWTFVGDGPDRLNLESAMKRADPLSRISLQGAVKYSEVRPFFEANDVFILVSDYEGLPLSLVEAMSYGLVPVVSDLESGVRDLVDSSVGYRVRQDDIDEYARTILYLNSHREELALKSHAARHRVLQEFSIAAMADRWLSLLRNSQTPVVWQQQFDVQGVLDDPNSWKYLRPVRSARRLLKRALGQSNQS